MYQKAREFRQNIYSNPSSSRNESDLAKANALLDKHAQTYARRSCRISSEIIVIEKEIELIENELKGFLTIYQQNFSTDPLNDFEKSEGITFFERRAEAFNITLKAAYRKLVKNIHPDMSDDHDVKYFHRVQTLYEKQDLAELLYVDTQLKEKNSPIESAILKIERFESEIKTNEKKLFKLIGYKSDIISSPQYQLFMKFKLSEARGYGIFNKLNENSQIN
jgi:hypothetical protein